MFCVCTCNRPDNFHHIVCKSFLLTCENFLPLLWNNNIVEKILLPDCSSIRSYTKSGENKDKIYVFVFDDNCLLPFFDKRLYQQGKLTIWARSPARRRHCLSHNKFITWSWKRIKKINAKFVMFSLTVFHSTALPLPNKTKTENCKKTSRVPCWICLNFHPYEFGSGPCCLHETGSIPNRSQAGTLC